MYQNVEELPDCVDIYIICVRVIVSISKLEVDLFNDKIITQQGCLYQICSITADGISSYLDFSLGFGLNSQVPW